MLRIIFFFFTLNVHGFEERGTGIGMSCGECFRFSILLRIEADDIQNGLRVLDLFLFGDPR